MSLPVMVYRWDDAGAPQLNTRTPADVLNILKKCLVTGYGTKAAGWAVVYDDSDNNGIVLQNSESLGSGGMVKFWPKTSLTTANDVIFMQNAPFISSITPDWTTVLGASFRDVLYAGRSYDNRWIIYATAACFYFLVFGSTSSTGGLISGTTTTMPIRFVGDYESFTPSDVHTFIAIGTPGLTGDIALTQGSMPESSFYYFITNQQLFRLYETTNLNNIKLGGILTTTPFSSGYGTAAVTATPSPDINLIFSPLIIGLHSSYIDTSGASTATQHLDSEGINTSRSMLQPVMRGKLPGLHLSSFFGCASQNTPYVWTGDGVDWHLFPQFHFGGSRLWLKIGDWYE